MFNARLEFVAHLFKLFNALYIFTSAEGVVEVLPFLFYVGRVADVAYRFGECRAVYSVIGVRAT